LPRSREGTGAFGVAAMCLLISAFKSAGVDSWVAVVGALRRLGKDGALLVLSLGVTLIYESVSRGDVASR